MVEWRRATNRSTATPVPRPAAQRDLPLEELAPRDFQRLALHLLLREPMYESVQPHGLDGPDGGVDISARIARADSNLAQDRATAVAVQVKRTAVFTKSTAQLELRRLTTASLPYARYLLITTATPSAQAIDELERGLAELGVPSLEVWDRSIVTARMLREPDLLRFFFGIESDSAGHEQRDAVTARLAARLLEGKKTIVYLGVPVAEVIGRASTDSSASHFLEALEGLIEMGAVTSVISAGADASLALGEMLPLMDSVSSAGRGLWLPETHRSRMAQSTAASKRSPEALVAAVNAQPEASAVVAIGLDADEQAALAPMLDLERGGDPIDLIVLGDASPDLAVSIAGHAFAALIAQLEPLQFIHAVQRIRFEDTYPAEDILSGNTVKPGIVHSGCWPEEIKESLLGDLKSGDHTVPIEITGLPGTGKTARAYFIANELCSGAAYYLDLIGKHGVTAAELRNLAVWLAGRHQEAVLVIDNAQEAAAAVYALRKALSSSVGNRLHLITVKTEQFENTDLFGGEIQEQITAADSWLVHREALAPWATDHVSPSDAPNLMMASLEARNLWHFFFLVRGGQSTLASELAGARKSDFSDIVWFIVAAGQVFEKQPGTVRNLYRLLDRRRLWPFTVHEGERGKWLLRAIADLLTNRRIVWTSNGVTCRHQLEAFGVIRLSHDRDPRITSVTFSGVIAEMFKEAIEPLAVPADVAEPNARLTKRLVYRFVDKYVEPLLMRQRELEQSVPYTDELQSHIEASWRGLLDLVERWPPHPLYWLFNRAGFASSFLRFSPFRALKGLNALKHIDGTGDAIDVVFAIRGILALEGLRQARIRWEIQHVLRVDAPWLRVAMRRAALTGDAEAAENLSEIAASYRRLSQQLTEESSPETDVIVAPVQDDGSDLDRQLALRTKVWLQHHEAALERAVGALSAVELIDQLKKVHPRSRPFLLAHVWFLAPTLALETFKRMPNTWKQALEDRIKESLVSYSPFHLAANDWLFAHFVEAVARERGELRAWLASAEAAVLGYGVSTIALTEGREQDGALMPAGGPPPGDIAELVGQDRLRQLDEADQDALVDFLEAVFGERTATRVLSRLDDRQLAELEETTDQEVANTLLLSYAGEDLDGMMDEELRFLRRDVALIWPHFNSPDTEIDSLFGNVSGLGIRSAELLLSRWRELRAGGSSEVDESSTG